MQFSEKITLLLRRSGLSQRALADELGLSNASVAGWAKGAKPRAAIAKRIADRFSVPVDVLVDDSAPLPVEFQITTDVAHHDPFSHQGRRSRSLHPAQGQFLERAQLQIPSDPAHPDDAVAGDLMHAIQELMRLYADAAAGRWNNNHQVLLEHLALRLKNIAARPTA